LRVLGGLGVGGLLLLLLGGRTRLCGLAADARLTLVEDLVDALQLQELPVDALVGAGVGGAGQVVAAGLLGALARDEELRPEVLVLAAAWVVARAARRDGPHPLTVGPLARAVGRHGARDARRGLRLRGLGAEEGEAAGDPARPVWRA
jgi:hypothetical protein